MVLAYGSGGQHMNEQEKHAVSQEERKEKIRARYKGVDRSELEFIPAKQKEKLFEDVGTKRVCAYCRVSTDDANQTSSYELQKNHYEDMIKEHAGWNLVGIYADEGISGTSLLHRDEFNRMISDCQAGRIDLIVTKSVSRFARNIVDCIAKVRELANMKPQVGVFFETEHIYTLDNTSEMMLAVLSAAAQEESHTKSEIMNISIEQRFSRGIFLTPKLLGYDKDEDGNLVINETEADTVRLCYYLFLSGFPTSEIAEVLMDLGRKTKLGNTKWTGSAVVNILRNERHCGDVLSRKTFTPNYLDHKSKKNNHDRNQYRQADHHEAIVSREIYNAAQKLLEAGKYSRKGYPLPTLQVVDQGVLKGFVPVNRAWNGFSTDDYKKASLSAYDEDSNEIHEEKTIKSTFDLSGYEIVRAQFFSTRFDPAVTISSGKIAFNTACMKKFENVEYVELLFNSVEKCIAVRPCEKSNVSENPFRRIRTKFKEEKVLPRIIPKNDIERLLNYMYGQLRKQKGKNILRDLTVVEMFFATGARVYEISNIRIENIDMKTGSIYFNGKGRKERVIQIGEQSVIKLLQKYYEQNKAQIEKSGYFFVNQKGDRFSEQSIRRMLKKYTKQAGISRNITPHMFRHSFATYLIEEGVDISCVQQILGHSSIKTTQIYIHVAAGIQAEILQKKHPRNKMHIWAA